MRHPNTIKAIQIKNEMLNERDERIKQLEARILKMQHEWNADVGQVIRERDAAIEQAKSYRNDCVRQIDQVELVEGERDAAIQRAEKAEREIERLREIVTEHDGVECANHDALVRWTIRELRQAELALAGLLDWYEDLNGVGFCECDSSVDLICRACRARAVLAHSFATLESSEEKEKDKDHE